MQPMARPAREVDREVRELVKRTIGALGRTTPGKHVIHAALRHEVVAARFPDVRSWPERVAGFEDLAFLFTSSQLNHGVASLRLDEAALLYRLARGSEPGTIVELGRFKGGSTFIFASAMPAGSRLWSVDLHVPESPELTGDVLDRELADALERYGLARNVELVVGDSRTVDLPPAPFELLFVDGDHSYEGARADLERWGELVRPGGHVLFHDAVDTAGYGNVYPGVAQVVAELEREDPRFVRAEGAGSIAHFVRAAD